MSQQDKQGVAFPSPPRDDDRVPLRDSFTNSRMISDHPIIVSDNPYGSDGQIIPSDTLLRMERKRKVYKKTLKRTWIVFNVLFLVCQGSFLSLSCRVKKLELQKKLKRMRFVSKKSLRNKIISGERFYVINH